MTFDPKLAAVVHNDPRYAYEAYEFVFHAIGVTHRVLGKEPPREGEDRHQRSITSAVRSCSRGSGKLALAEFGMLAKTVFRIWGVKKTDDWGNIVFNLIEAELMNKTSEDRLDDFHAVYDFDKALEYRITLDEAR